MYAYANYCPVAATTSVVGDYWTPLILRELLFGTTHFNQLVRNLPAISRSLLADRLRRLERAGVLECQRLGPNVTNYVLTPAGRDLQGLLDSMHEWGLRWGRRDPNPENVDPVLVICMLKDRIRITELPAERVVLEVRATGPQEARAWLLCEGGGVSLCFDPPGFDIDLWVTGSVPDLYEIWLQRTTMGAALRRGRIQLDGPARLSAAFVRWFDGAKAVAAGVPNRR